MVTGFGVFGKDEAKNSMNEAIEELADDLESQQVKDIMGISEFGRKAKTFDITVCTIRLQLKDSISKENKLIMLI